MCIKSARQTTVLEPAVAAKGEGRASGAKRRPLVDARQMTPEELDRQFPGVDFDVPTSLAEAQRVFVSHPSIRIILAGLGLLIGARLGLGVWSLSEAVAVPLVAVGWVLQEWAIHKFLLHGLSGWYGYDIHVGHHALPFYHVSIDPPSVVVAWGAVANALALCLLPRPLALTSLIVYWLMGLLYEWAHFVVHTRVHFTSGLGKAIKAHHTRHHLKDDRYWFAFTVPHIDDVMGSVPHPSSHLDTRKAQ